MSTVAVFFILCSLLLVCKRVKTEEDEGSPPFEHNQRIIQTKQDLIEHVTGVRLNLKKLLAEYKTICQISGSGEDRHNYFEECTCDCSSKCIERQNCCPDCIYGYIKLGCVNIASKGRKEFVSLVDRCHFTNETDLEIVAGCESDKSLISPVVDLSAHMSYKNSQCARCNGAVDFKPWIFDYICKQKILDYELSWNNIEEELEKHECIIKFSPEGSSFRCDIKQEYRLISSCNVTGLWKEYDEEIERACNILNGRFRDFKNVFCYICNPSIASTEMRVSVDRCDVENRSLSESEITVACKRQVKTDRLAPFGNTCFMLCNGIGNTLRYLGENSSSKVVLEVQELVDPKLAHSEVMISLMFKGLEILGEIRTLFADVYGARLISKSIKRNKTINEWNVEQQIRTYIDICGDKFVCNKSFRVGTVNNSFLLAETPYCEQKCSCFPSCAEYNNCCPDVLLQKQPYSCIRNDEFIQIVTSQKFVSSTDYKAIINDDTDKLVIDKCLNNTSEYFSRMCAGNNIADIDFLSYIPARTTKSFIAYKNIYCLLCNLNEEQEITIDITLRCNSFFEAVLFPNIKALLTTAKDKCSTIFKPRFADTCKKRYAPTASGSDLTVFKRCNETGFWSEENSAIRNACEDEDESVLALPEYRYNLNIYKNFACFECNPGFQVTELSVTDAISKCNKTLFYNATYQKQCDEHVFHPRWFPYKNVFCARCNLPDVPVPPTDYSTVTPAQLTADDFYSLRTLFYVPVTTLKSITDDKASFHHKTSCLGETQTTTQKNCPKLYCSNERFLANGTCQLKNDTSYSLTYWLGFKLTPTLKSRGLDGDAINISTICTAIPESIIKRVDPNTKHLSYGCVINTNVSCIKEFTVDLEEITVLVFSYRVEIINTNDVSSLERALVNALDGKYTIETMLGREYEMQASPTASESMRKFSKMSSCTYYRKTYVVAIPFVVNKFLICPQIQLNESDVSFNEEENTLTLLSNNMTFTEEHFTRRKLRGKSVFRVCFDDYRRHILPKKKDVLLKSGVFELAYVIFSNVCILFSLICLLLTFITYCIFSSLRSIPGKNIMLLIFTLFFAQALLQFGTLVSKGTLFCAAIGAFIHYFWLSTFCAMNVCSFHMFKLFCVNVLAAPNRNDNHFTFLKYCMYVFGVPLFCVVVIVACFSIFSDGAFSGYGRYYCFISDFLSLILGFIVPSSLLFIANIIFFGLSLHKIRSAPRMRGTADHRNFILYMKMCTIIGVTWPMQVVDGLLDLSVFSLFASFFNGFQGVFIFMSYVCNARVLSLYKSLVRKTDKYRSTTRTITTSDTIETRETMTTSS